MVFILFFSVRLDKVKVKVRLVLVFTGSSDWCPTLTRVFARLKMVFILFCSVRFDKDRFQMVRLG